MEILKILIMIFTIAIIAMASLYLTFDLFRVSITKKRAEESAERSAKISKRRGGDRIDGQK